MRNSDEVISHLVLALFASYSAYVYLDKNGTNFTCFGISILIYLLYSLSGLILYSMDTFSDFWYKIYSTGHRLVLTLGFTLYLINVLFATSAIPIEGTYTLLAVSSAIALISLNDGYIRYNYTDLIMFANASLYGYMCYKTQDIYFYMTELFAILAYYIYRKNIRIMDRNPQQMSNYIHAFYLNAATCTI